MLHTVLCDLLDIEVPVLNAPMGGGVAGGRLAAAVSAAGGFGLIGGQSAGGVPWLREQLAVARAHGDRPVGVGFISHLPPTAALVDAALEAGVRVLCHSFVDPAPWVEPARRAGAIVLAQVQSVALARRAVEAGVDVIIAQGTEAGGHTGGVGLLALLPRVLDVAGGPDGIPVVAAGAIADGRTMAAALLLGAAGVLVGTRFVATEECDGRPSVRRRLAAADADADATVLTEVFDLAAGLPWPEGVRGRSLRSPFTERWHGREDELRAWGREERARYRAAAETDDDLADRYAGQGVGLIDAVEPAGVVLRRLAADAEAVLRNRPAAVLADPDRRRSG
ncbi:MAG: NAD(P)H-dependent flavin oxidoreductase [Acidimicrobiia bacterium]